QSIVRLVESSRSQFDFQVGVHPLNPTLTAIRPKPRRRYPHRYARRATRTVWAVNHIAAPTEASGCEPGISVDIHCLPRRDISHLRPPSRQVITIVLVANVKRYRLHKSLPADFQASVETG